MHDKQIWLNEALALCPDIIRSEASEYLTPLIKRCHSRSRKAWWQWARIQLAKSQDTALLLSWMQESRLRPVEQAKNGGFKYVLSEDGSTALIDVTSGDDHAVWRISATHLDWALSVHPVRLKRLPELESHNAAEIRKLKRKIAREMPFLTPAQRTGLESGIAELEESERRAYTPVPRFMLVKYQDGRETQVHRLFLQAGDNDRIETVDGDFLNFATTTVRLTMTPINCGWIRPVADCQTEVTIQNLQVINNAEAQKDFERSFLQVKETPHGDIKTSLAVRPNADLGKRTGVNGRVLDCGDFDLLSPEEKIDAGLQGTSVRPKDETEAIRRKWKFPKPQRGSRWGV